MRQLLIPAWPRPHPHLNVSHSYHHKWLRPPKFCCPPIHDQSLGPKLHVPSRNSLQLTRLDNGRALAVLDSTAARASGLNGLDNIHGLLVGDLAEDDVATVEPRGDDGGDEELGAVAAERVRTRPEAGRIRLHSRVGASVSHGQQTGAVVGQLEVLIAELLAVDGLATGAL